MIHNPKIDDIVDDLDSNKSGEKEANAYYNKVFDQKNEEYLVKKDAEELNKKFIEKKEFDISLNPKPFFEDEYLKSKSGFFSLQNYADPMALYNVGSVRFDKLSFQDSIGDDYGIPPAKQSGYDLTNMKNLYSSNAEYMKYKVMAGQLETKQQYSSSRLVAESIVENLMSGNLPRPHGITETQNQNPKKAQFYLYSKEFAPSEFQSRQKLNIERAIDTLQGSLVQPTLIAQRNAVNPVRDTSFTVLDSDNKLIDELSKMSGHPLQALDRLQLEANKVHSRIQRENDPTLKSSLNKHLDKTVRKIKLLEQIILRVSNAGASAIQKKYREIKGRQNTKQKENKLNENVNDDFEIKPVNNSLKKELDKELKQISDKKALKRGLNQFSLNAKQRKSKREEFEKRVEERVRMGMEENSGIKNRMNLEAENVYSIIQPLSFSQFQTICRGAGIPMSKLLLKSGSTTEYLTETTLKTYLSDSTNNAQIKGNVLRKISYELGKRGIVAYDGHLVSDSGNILI